MVRNAPLRLHAVPRLLRHVDDAAGLGDADVVVEHVDAAVGSRAGVDHGGDVAGIGDVGPNRPRLAALVPDDVRRLLRGGGIDVGADHLRALPGERDSGRLAVAPARAD
jgi:hypothetical protein